MLFKASEKNVSDAFEQHAVQAPKERDAELGRAVNAPALELCSVYR